MEYRENWAISFERVSQYFAGQADVKQVRPGHFCFDDVRIALTRLPDGLLAGGALPRTEVHITGPDAAAKEIHRRFFLRFLSAGG